MHALSILDLRDLGREAKGPRWDCCGTSRHFHDQKTQVRCQKAGPQQGDRAKQRGCVPGEGGGSPAPRLLASIFSFVAIPLLRQPSQRERRPMGNLRVRGRYELKKGIFLPGIMRDELHSLHKFHYDIS